MPVSSISNEANRNGPLAASYLRNNKGTINDLFKPAIEQCECILKGK